MFFDATGKHDGSVVEAVEKLFSCCVPTEESAGQKKPSPPLVVLQWGAITSFPAFVTSVSAKYTLFSRRRAPDPGPVHGLARGDAQRAVASRTRPPAATPSAASHTLVAGDSLASVAYAEYGDPTLWRPLAWFNGIDDPLRCRPGTRAAAARRPRSW